MNSDTAAALTSMIMPKFAVPCHHWMFAEHGGDPQSFKEKCKELCPEVEVMLMRPGRRYVFGE